MRHRNYEKVKVRGLGHSGWPLKYKYCTKRVAGKHRRLKCRKFLAGFRMLPDRVLKQLILEYFKYR